MPDSIVILACGEQDYLEGKFPTIDTFDERWGVNNCWCDFHEQAPAEKRLTKIIAMDDLRRDRADYPRYVEQIVTAGVPVVTATAYPEYPNTEPYPLWDVVKSVWPNSEDDGFDFTVLDNTINYAVALALYQGVKRLGLFGCEFTRHDPKWIRGRKMGPHPDWFTYYQEDAVLHRRPTEPGAEALMFLLGMAYARGVELLIPAGSSLFDSDRPLNWYGYQEQPKP